MAIVRRHQENSLEERIWVNVSIQGLETFTNAPLFMHEQVASVTFPHPFEFQSNFLYLKFATDK